jgi:transposase-like protein
VSPRTTKKSKAAKISAHFAEIYGASVSKETVSRITDQVVGEMSEWQSRPLDSVYAAVFIDAVHVKIRDGQVANRPIYAAIGVTLEGRRDVLGLWAGRSWIMILRSGACCVPRMRLSR